MSIGLIGANITSNVLAQNISRSNSVHLFETKNTKTNNQVRYDNLKIMIDTMERPRTIMTMERDPDSKTTVHKLSKFLSPDDTIMECNENFSNTLGNERKCKRSGIHYLGVGVATGSVSEPSIMVGGDLGTFSTHSDLLKTVSPNVVYISESPDSGHVTKIIHDAMESAMYQCLSDVFTYCNYNQTLFECMMYYAVQFSVNGNLLRNALSSSRKYDMCNNISYDVPDTLLLCSEASLNCKLFTPVLNASTISKIHCLHTFSKSVCNLETNKIKEETVAGAILFIFACIILEGCDMLRAHDISVERGVRAWKRGSAIECEMLHLDCGEIEKIKMENVQHARRLLLGCISHERSVPLVSAAIDAFDFQRCSGHSVNFKN